MEINTFVEQVKKTAIGAGYVTLEGDDGIFRGIKAETAFFFAHPRTEWFEFMPQKESGLRTVDGTGLDEFQQVISKF